MNVGGIPFSGGPNGFWMVVGLIATLFALVAIVVYRFRFRFF
jgi:Mg2+ and Co2+ transporter CorA